MHNATIATILRIVTVAVLSGCAVSPESPYRDPGEMRGRTTDFTTYDVQQCATALIDALLGSRNLDGRIRRQFGDKIPVVAIRLENLTFQLSATDKLKKSMFKTIESRLLDSGRFEFVDRRAEQLIVGDTIHEMNGVIVKDGGAAGLKDVEGVDYILAGELEEFREGDGRIHDTYYKMTVKLYNKHTKRIDWSGDKEIRKVSTRPVVGW